MSETVRSEVRDEERSSVLRVTLAQLPGSVGAQLGPSPWQRITQERVSAFAELTGDLNFIHIDPERASRTLFGGTVAHGFLTLALLAPITQELIVVTDAPTSVNYGLDRLRFPAPLPVGAEYRGRGEVTAASEIEGGMALAATFTIEIRDRPKPALVAQCLFRHYA